VNAAESDLSGYKEVVLRLNSAATLPHNLIAGWIGGLLPLIVAWLKSGLGKFPCRPWYQTLFLELAVLVALLLLPETKTVNLSK
jgi:hypothetical protein